MKQRIIFIVAAAIVFFSPFVLAQSAPKYNHATELTLKGSLLYVADHPSREPWTGLYAIMKDGNNEIEVHLAPAYYFDRYGVALKTGDTVTVVGSKTKWRDTDIILGRDLTTEGGTRVVIRDADGHPAWRE